MTTLMHLRHFLSYLGETGENDFSGTLRDFSKDVPDVMGMEEDGFKGKFLEEIDCF